MLDLKVDVHLMASIMVEMQELGIDELVIRQLSFTPTSLHVLKVHDAGSARSLCSHSVLRELVELRELGGDDDEEHLADLRSLHKEAEQASTLEDDKQSKTSNTHEKYTLCINLKLNITLHDSSAWTPNTSIFDIFECKHRCPSIGVQA